MSDQDTLNPTLDHPEDNANEPIAQTQENGMAADGDGPVAEKQDAGEKKKKKKGFFGGHKEEEPSKPCREEELQKEVDEWKDKYLRLFSEFDNFRKRTSRERIELAKTASSDLIVQLLPVIDDFERAMKSLDKSNEATAPYFLGMELIYNKFVSLLSRQGLKAMETKEQVFDTDFHEALTNIPAPTEELKGKVVDEIEKGYLLHEKVVRYAKVVVGS
jgi:molecular chaperone GrpE